MLLAGGAECFEFGEGVLWKVGVGFGAAGSLPCFGEFPQVEALTGHLSLLVADLVACLVQQAQAIAAIDDQG
ncbi:hypothetical protein [Amycolatopsis sp. BJA-103]|uniref:hypothetical protein n=1 Tax=unclassified Amycolatopsis TaxID=2618356 RepID=UPI001E5F4365|nr:hypothetical protein [Amycolatopsis sp. BJA-103]